MASMINNNKDNVQQKLIYYRDMYRHCLSIARSNCNYEYNDLIGNNHTVTATDAAARYARAYERCFKILGFETISKEQRDNNLHLNLSLLQWDKYDY